LIVINQIVILSPARPNAAESTTRRTNASPRSSRNALSGNAVIFIDDVARSDETFSQK